MLNNKPFGAVGDPVDAGAGFVIRPQTFPAAPLPSDNGPLTSLAQRLTSPPSKSQPLIRRMHDVAAKHPITPLPNPDSAE